MPVAFSNAAGRSMGSTRSSAALRACCRRIAERNRCRAGLKCFALGPAPRSWRSLPGLLAWPATLLALEKSGLDLSRYALEPAFGAHRAISVDLKLGLQILDAILRGPQPHRK